MEMTELAELSQATNDPLYLFNLLGDKGAAKASLTTEGQQYILFLTDDDGTLMNKLMDEIVGKFGGELLDPTAQAEMEEALNNLGFSSIEYKMWIDQDSYLATEIYLAFDLTMTVEKETLSFKQVSTGRYKDYGSFDTITVPEEIKSNAINIRDFLQDMTNDLEQQSSLSNLYRQFIKETSPTAEGSHPAQLSGGEQ